MKKLICAVTVLAVSTAQADTIFVDDDATPGGDGLSWNTAYRFLQDALANAVAGTEIRVAQGVYKPDRDEANPDPPSASDCCFLHAGSGCDDPDCQATVCAVDPFCCNTYWNLQCAELASTLCGVACPDRAPTFQLLSGVVLKGGFAGIGTPNPDDRDIALYETVLSGDLLGNDNPDNLVDATHDDNSYHVVNTSGVDATTVLDGFTLTAGNDNNWFPHLGGGGGIWNDSGSPTAAHCLFIENFVARGARGMFNSTGNPIVTNCMFIENLCYGDGGGMFNSNSTLTVTNSTFSGNGVGGAGGGIANVGLSTVTFTNCTISDHVSAHDAGGMYNDESTVALTNCTISGNIAIYSNGGGILNRFSDLPLSNCVFTGSHSYNGAGPHNRAPTQARTTSPSCQCVT